MTNTNKTKLEMQKGLSSLLGNIQKNQTQPLPTATVNEFAHFSEISIHQIVVNTKNPRTHFDTTALNELADSIRSHGIIQPITVLKITNGKFQIIAGERRFRAAKLAGLNHIPAYIRKANDNQVVEWAIIENLQREDLNPIELALGLQRMIEEMSYTHEQVAERVGKDRSTITNTLRLLKLPPDAQAALKENKISTGHARAIINIEHIDLQLQLLKDIQNKHLSVRQTEEAVRRIISKNSTKNKASQTQGKDIHTKKLEQDLGARLQCKVEVNLPSGNKLGSIVLPFKTIKELNDISERILKQKS